MAKKMINKTHVEGRVYENKLELKVSQKGVTYIGGKLHVATDEAGLNVVTVDYPYVAEKYNNGNENKTFTTLKAFVDVKDAAGNIVTPKTAKSIMEHGKEEATMVRLDPSIGLNEFYREEGGKDLLVSVKRNEGGFAHVVQSLNADEGARNTFEADMVITGTVLVEGDPEKGTEDKLKVKGCIFNFANKLMPIELSVINPNGIKYFENLDATPGTPVFTKVWGKQISETIITTITEESAFGDAVVKESKKERKDWVITGTSTAPYEFDVDGVLTAQELKEFMAAREVHLAELLQGQKERAAKKAQNNNAFTASAPAPTAGGFTF